MSVLKTKYVYSNAFRDISILSAEITMIPTTTTDLDAQEDKDKLRKMLDQLEEDDDVQNVYTNWGNEE